MKNKSLSDYCVINPNPENRLSRFERLTLLGGEELEKALEWVARRYDGSDYDGEQFVVDFAERRRAQQLFSGLKVEQFFVPPAAPLDVVEVPVHGLPNGSISDLSFPSAYRLFCMEAQERFVTVPENATVHARYWRHSEPARAAVVAVHGWTMGDQRINALAFLPGFFYRLGLDVVLLELPFHGRRSPGGNVHSGELFPSADFLRTNEAIGQAISDLRQVVLWLKLRGLQQIGSIGVSLGGYISALWAGLDELDYCIPVVPLVSMGGIAWEVVRAQCDEAQLMRHNVNRDMLESIYQIHAPLEYEVRVPRARRMIIAGLGDAMVPAEQPRALWQHWERPQIHWLMGGHAAQFKLKKSQVLEDIERFLLKIGIAEQAVLTVDD